MTNLKSLEICAKVHLDGVVRVIEMLDSISENSLMTVNATEMKDVIAEIKKISATTENKKYKTFLNNLIKECESKIYKVIDK